jgi:hypothetical protein
MAGLGIVHMFRNLPIIFIALIHIYTVSGACINCLKVLRFRQFIDDNCTHLNPYGDPFYASVDGSCLCLSSIATWSQSERGGCESSSGTVIGKTYNATFNQNNACWVDDESGFLSGIINVCTYKASHYSLFVDIIYINRPLYIWQWLAVAIGCLLTVIISIIVLCKRCKRNKDTSPSEFLMHAVVQSDG